MSRTRSSILYPNWAFLSLFILLFHLPTALSQLSIPLTFYTDNLCADPSTENPSFSAKINVCIVTTGLGSVSFPVTPCTSGSVILLGYSDSTCTTSISIFKTDNCIAPISGDVAAVLATCNQENDGNINVTPTATTTVPVGQVAGSAATSAAVNGGTVTTSMSTPSGFTTITTLAAQATSNSPNPAASSNSSLPLSGLSTNDIIAIAVGLGVPFLLILFAIRNKSVNGSYGQVLRHTETSTYTSTMEQYQA